MMTNSKTIALAAGGIVLIGSMLPGCGSEFFPPSASPGVGLDAASVAQESAAALGVGDCCFEGVGPGCSDPNLEACVCAERPACCTGSWTLECVGTAVACGGCENLTNDERDIATLLIDSDNDGLLDLEEIIAGLNPFNRFDGPDIDGDGIDNGDDPDVDGDGTTNAYDNDVDGDGIENRRDDDIDGDGLLNRILDNDDDADGISNLLDNDDDADGLPDPPDADGDEDDDGDDDEECEKNSDCASNNLCADGKCVTASNAATMGPTNDAKCSANGDCDGNEVCAVDLGDGESRPQKLCITADPSCDPRDDEDGDGVCDRFDPDPDGNGDTDDDDDGVSDLDERALGTDPNDPDSDDDGVPDGQDVAPNDDEVALADPPVRAAKVRPVPADSIPARMAIELRHWSLSPTATTNHGTAMMSS